MWKHWPTTHSITFLLLLLTIKQCYQQFGNRCEVWLGPCLSCTFTVGLSLLRDCGPCSHAGLTWRKLSVLHIHWRIVYQVKFVCVAEVVRCTQLVIALFAGFCRLFILDYLQFILLFVCLYVRVHVLQWVCKENRLDTIVNLLSHHQYMHLVHDHAMVHLLGSKFQQDYYHYPVGQDRGLDTEISCSNKKTG